MRILAVTPYYEPEGGGLERYAHAILRRLVTRGHEVQVHTFTGHTAGRADQDGVDVLRRVPWLRLGNAPIDPRFPSVMRNAMRTFAPDVVVGHTPVPFAAEVAEATAHRAGIPFVTNYHAGRLAGSSLLLHGLATIDRATFEHRMLRRSSHLIAASGFVRDHPLAAHRAHVTVVPPGVDRARFARVEPPNAENILFLGPLSKAYRWKGVDTLWRAFHLVAAAVPTARLTLAGQGDRWDEFSSLARASGKVRLPGRVSDPELVAEYQRASVVVLPSTSDAEAFGMVLAEANACGRPVVASRIGGIPDFVTHGENGLLARPGDHVDLADRIITLLRDKALARRLGDSGHAKVVRDHDWTNLAGQTEGILESVSRGRSGSPCPAAPSVTSLGRGAA